MEQTLNIEEIGKNEDLASVDNADTQNSHTIEEDDEMDDLEDEETGDQDISDKQDGALLQKATEGDTTTLVPEKETKWYVLRVVSGKERKTKEYLDKDIIRNGWDKIIKQVFLPSQFRMVIRIYFHHKKC